MSLAGRWEFLLLAWFLGIIAVTGHVFRWQVEYFREPGDAYFYLILAFLPVAAIATALYARFRGPALIRWEPLFLISPLLIVLLRQPLGSTAALLLCCSALFIGRWTLDRLRLTSTDAPEWALSFVAGVSLIAWSLSVAGMAGFSGKPLMWFIAVTPALTGIRFAPDVWGAVQNSCRLWASDPEVRRPLAGVVIPFLLASALSGILVVASPPTSHDAINFHLPLAQKWSATGTLTPSFDYVYSFYPQIFEVLMAWAYTLGGAAAAQAFCFSLTIGGLALCWRLTRLIGGTRSAALAALAIMAAAPAVHWMASVLKNDFLMATLQIACLVCFLHWRSSHNFRWVLAGCWLLGSSFGVKHTAIFAAVAIGLLGLQALWQQRSRLTALAAVAVLFAVSGSMWHVRTYLLAGDPAFPSSQELAVRAVDSPATSYRSHPLTRLPRTIYKLHGHSGAYQFENILSAPLGIINSLLFPLLLFLPNRGKGTLRGPVGVVVCVTLAYWVFTIGNVRYAVTPLLLLPSLLSIGLFHVHQTASARLRFVLSAIVIYGLFFGWTGGLIIENSGPQIRYVAGAISADDYIESVYPSLPAIRALGRIAASDDDVLAVGCCAPFYFPNGWKFNCAETREADPEFRLAKKMAAEGLYEYFIAPGPVTPQRLNIQTPSAIVYQDRRCTVHRLSAQAVE